MIRVPIQPVSGCQNCDSQEPIWRGGNVWLCNDCFDTGTVYGSPRNHAGLLISELGTQAASPDPELANHLFQCLVWLREPGNIEDDDPHLIVLGRTVVYEVGAESPAVAPQVLAIVDNLRYTPFETMIHNLAEAVKDL